MIIISREELFNILLKNYWNKPLNIPTVKEISTAIESICTLKFLPDEHSLKCLRAELFRLKQNGLQAKVKGGSQFRKFKEQLKHSKYSWDVKVDREETQFLVDKIKADTEKDLRDKEKENKELREKLCNLSAVIGTPEVKPIKRKAFADCTPSWQSKIRKKDEEHCKKALSFLKDSDAVPVSVTVVRNGKEEVLRLYETGENKENQSLEASETLDDLNALIYILDTFNISKDAYHELSMAFKTLPRINAVNKVLSDLNSKFDIIQTPDGLGVQQSLKKHLHDVLSHKIKTDKNFAPAGKVKIKISGDGTNIGKRIHVVNVTFTIVNEERSASVRGNYPLAVIRTAEKYSDLVLGLSDLVKEVEELDGNSLKVQHRSFDIEIVLGGDYKFLLLATGISSVACQHFCIYCTCNKAEKLDLSRNWSMVDPSKGARLEYKCEELVQSSSLKRKKVNKGFFSVKNKPLFPSITPNRVVIDHLHMYLRISDKLFNLLLSDLRCLDNINENSTFTSVYEKKDKLKHVLKLENVLQQLGIHFEIGVNQETKKLDYRDLTGPEKRVLFDHFHASDLFEDKDRAAEIQELWDGFKDINELIKSENPDPDEIEAKAKSWCALYIQVYQTRDITPYIHLLRYHVGEIIRTHGTMVRFSQQGLEKLNDNITKQFFRGSCHRGLPALKQVLEKQNRLLFLEGKGKRTKESRKCSNCHGADHNSKSCAK
ncbi:uncharacterized protein LOC132560929 [Ylistrum balloti]|uniref:uncharacterized protein LOC132560929 n=1 Tax=Ylistrum balloti TaxID=509963 RepID=UPI002905C794|nr:uncharacterized protein LOC132560929 [Ylistrum balloti]